MKKFLLSLAFVASFAVADELPKNNREILEHCNMMANFAVITASSRLGGMTNEDFAKALNEVKADKELPPEISDEITTAMVYGYLVADLMQDPHAIGSSAMRSCIEFHRKRLDKPAL